MQKGPQCRSHDLDPEGEAGVDRGKDGNLLMDFLDVFSMVTMVTLNFFGLCLMFFPWSH